jgi:Insect cuticle protein
VAPSLQKPTNTGYKAPQQGHKPQTGDNKPVEYHFKYEVNDPETHDHHSQEEKRIGDHVKGHYKLVDSDGYLRTVSYSADDKSGFMAEVQREPLHCQRGHESGKAEAKYESQKQYYVHQTRKPAVLHHY